MPKVSIVLPIFNGESFLVESINSILSQSFKDWELLIVNDGSTDGTEVISKKYAQQYPHIKYFKNPKNIKLPATLNRGFTEAVGEYFTWTSADNIYLPTALEKLVKTLDANKHIALVYSDYEYINEKREYLGYFKSSEGKNIIYRNVVGSCFMYRRSLAHKIGDYNTSEFLCEDYEYWLRICLASGVKNISECLYQHRMHPSSLTTQRRQEIVKKGIALRKKYKKFFLKSREDKARFYCALREADIYNPFRQFYLFLSFYYHPLTFFKEFLALTTRKVDLLTQ